KAGRGVSLPCGENDCGSRRFAAVIVCRYSRTGQLMASVFPNVSRPAAGSLLGRVLSGRGQQAPDDRLHAILTAIDDALQSGGSIDTMLGILEDSKRTLFEFLRAHFDSPVVAKALTLKVINICLAKQHFRTR